MSHEFVMGCCVVFSVHVESDQISEQGRGPEKPWTNGRFGLDSEGRVCHNEAKRSRRRGGERGTLTT